MDRGQKICVCACVCVHVRVYAHVCADTLMHVCRLWVDEDLEVLVAGKPNYTWRKDKDRFGFKMSSDLEVARFYYYWYVNEKSVQEK